MPLVYTTTEGADPHVRELLTPANNTARPLVQNLSSDIVANTSAVAGATVTAALNALNAAAAVPTLQRQIGWNPAVNSNLIDLVPAGHTPGMYEVSFTLVVRTTSATAQQANLFWNTPTIGAETKGMSLSIIITSPGTTFGNNTTSQVPHRVVSVVSDGSAAIQFQMPAAGVAGLADIYAVARLIGTL